MSNAVDVLLRTKSGTGDDTDWVASNTVPGAADLGNAPSYPQPGQDTIHRLEVCVIPIDATGAPVARTGTVDMTLVKVIRRDPLRSGNEAGSDDPVVVDTATITGVNFNALQDVPFAGGEYSIRLSNFSAPPGSATDFEIWVKSTIR